VLQFERSCLSIVSSNKTVYCVVCHWSKAKIWIRSQNWILPPVETNLQESQEITGLTC
jgi:hypothetical protein